MADAIIVTSKCGQMVEILKSAIERGDYAEGGRITSENELSSQHGISRNTVREAISSLVQQGYLTRTQGKGTFVASRRPQAASSSAYAIFIHAHDHVYEGESRALVRAFQRLGALPMVFDVREIQNDAQTEQIMTKLLEQGVAGIVVEDGISKLLADTCRRLGQKMPLLAVVNTPAAPDIDAISVVADFEAGTRLATEHLLKLGHRRILFVIHRNQYAPAGSRLDTYPGMYGDAVRGYTAALAAAGLADQEQFLFIDHEFAYGSDDRDRLKQIFSSPECPDAVFAFGDYRAKHVIDIADESGLKVPDDLSVIGYWNTPWAEMTRVPLASISVQEDEIGRIAAEKLVHAHANGTSPKEHVVVKPRLILRASCSGKRRAS